MIRRVCFCLAGALLLLLTSASYAAGFLPFDSTSRQTIEQVYSGKPLILAFWSVDCAYCADDLKLLGNVVRQHPEIALVTVCTDSAEMTPRAQKMLDDVKLPAHRTWQFSEPDVERLRYNIDKRWYGELPRTYFYDAGHQVKAVSGSPDAQWLAAWLERL